MPEPQNLDALVERRAAFLKDYQNAAYAQRYRNTVRTVRIAEAKLARGFSGLAEAMARNLFTLMAYKDEYEVARLYTDGAFIKKLQRQFDGDFTLEYHLAPPLLARRDPATGEPKKRAFGPWMRHVFKLLTWLRPLRGTALDIFGYTRERRMERRLIADYEAILRELSASLGPENHALAIEIASLPAKMRGFGHIKARNVESAKACEASCWRCCATKIVRYRRLDRGGRPTFQAQAAAPRWRRRPRPWPAPARSSRCDCRGSRRTSSAALREISGVEPR